MDQIATTINKGYANFTTILSKCHKNNRVGRIKNFRIIITFLKKQMKQRNKVLNRMVKLFFANNFFKSFKMRMIKRKSMIIKILHKIKKINKFQTKNKIASFMMNWSKILHLSKMNTRNNFKKITNNHIMIINKHFNKETKSMVIKDNNTNNNNFRMIFQWAMNNNHQEDSMKIFNIKDSLNNILIIIKIQGNPNKIRMIFILKNKIFMITKKKNKKLISTTIKDNFNSNIIILMNKRILIINNN